MSEWIRGTLLIALSLLTVTTMPAQEAGSQQWLREYASARNLSRQSQRPLLIHFYSDSCPPCVLMERETIQSPELLSLFGERLLAVKLNSAHHPELVDLFQIEGIPADVLVAPGGQILDRHEGYRSRSDYLRWLSGWMNRLPAPSSQPKPRPTPPEPRPQPESQRPFQSPMPLVERRPQEPEQRPVQPDPQFQPRPPLRSGPLVGLDGYSPVRIQRHRQWQRGRPEFSVMWQGVVYYCVTEEEQQLFQSAPEKFAPRLLGCDPVELARSERAMQGSVQYGAFYDGELFLFRNPETRNDFKLNPDRYVQMRHVFHADDVVGTRLR